MTHTLLALGVWTCWLVVASLAFYAGMRWTRRYARIALMVGVPLAAFALAVAVTLALTD